MVASLRVAPFTKNFYVSPKGLESCGRANLGEGETLTALPLTQNLLLVWSQMTRLIDAMIVMFAVGYVSFQRQ